MPNPTPLAQPGGITYGEVKTILARVVDNGVCDTDPRVLERTNEATQLILGGEIIPVGAMATYDIVADGTILFLPPQLENAIEVEVLNEGQINSQSDVRQGWYDLVNNFAYVDPTFQFDFPLQDLFLHPDPQDPNVLRRKYDFPGLTQGATVRVTGKKRYVPIKSDSDYLIIQNIRALKETIMGLERSDINDPDNRDKYFASANTIIAREVKSHLLDPRNALKRRAHWEQDLAKYPPNSFGWMRAALTLEIPELLSIGKNDVTSLTEQAERRILSKGLWKGTIEVFNAQVVAGLIQLPQRAESVLMARLDGRSIDVRSIFFSYQKNGPGWLDDMICSCSAILHDDGEVYNRDTRQTRHQYRLTGALSPVQTGVETPVTNCLSMACKLRWVKKAPEEQMVIKNFDAMRLMIEAIMKKDQNMAAAAVAEAERETNQWLGGQQAVIHVDMVGCPLGGETL